MTVCITVGYRYEGGQQYGEPAVYRKRHFHLPVLCWAARALRRSSRGASFVELSSCDDLIAGKLNRCRQTQSAVYLSDFIDTLNEIVYGSGWCGGLNLHVVPNVPSSTLVVKLSGNADLDTID